MSLEPISNTVKQIMGKISKRSLLCPHCFKPALSRWMPDWNPKEVFQCEKCSKPFYIPETILCSNCDNAFDTHFPEITVCPGCKMSD